MKTVSEYLAADGPVAQSMLDFTPRLQQQQMADAIAHAIDRGTVLVAEAGTGTGKTFAYLVPALLSGLKTLISTGTKNLQDQLFHRDLPVIREALDLSVTVALLKGRSNYLCKHRLSQAEQGNKIYTQSIIKKIIAIRDWSTTTVAGDIAEMSDISENDPVWSYVTSTADNCLGQDCRDYNDCYLVKARRQAQASDIVVINHYLLLSDMMIRDTGFGELLPAADAFIIDEAHQLHSVASKFFGISLSSQQIKELASDVVTAYIREINEDRNIINLCDQLNQAVQSMRLAMGTEVRRSAWHTLKDNSKLIEAIHDIINKLTELQNVLKPLSERSKTLDSYFARGQKIISSFNVLTLEPPEQHIHWFETYKRSFTLHLTPLDIGKEFNQQMEQLSGSWVFTSATLTVGEKFDHYLTEMGLPDTTETHAWQSPFDFMQQCLVYLPESMPEPAHWSYTEKVVQKALPVIEAYKGNTFFLFTSYRALNIAAEMLREHIDYPLLVQGEQPRDVLIKYFRQAGNAVLLGTYSFWEGVDVKGEALSCVIIDKLPFASPGDPVIKARIDAIRARGLNPFFAYQIPTAVINLKQGAGRLIRDNKDRGVLMLCDPRLKTKPYGKIFLNSLPSTPITTSINKVLAFIAKQEIQCAEQH